MCYSLSPCKEGKELHFYDSCSCRTIRTLFWGPWSSLKNEISCSIPLCYPEENHTRVFGFTWSISSLEKAFSPGKFSCARCQEAVQERKAAAAVLVGIQGRTEYPAWNILPAVASGLEPDTLPKWQGKPYLPAEWWVPLTTLLLFRTNGAFHFFDWLSYFIAQVLCGILLAFVIGVCFERLTFILLQAFTARTAANGQAIHFIVNIGLGKREENMDSI